MSDTTITPPVSYNARSLSTPTDQAYCALKVDHHSIGKAALFIPRTLDLDASVRYIFRGQNAANNRVASFRRTDASPS